MTHDISALVFDAYGTLFDVHSVTRRAEALFPGQGAALSRAWRGKQLEYSWLRTLMDRYENFDRVTREALEWSLQSLGLPVDDDACAALIAEYRRLEPFPEVRDTLLRLAQQRPLAILSNGHPAMLEALVDHNGMRPLFRGGILSVDAVKRFKPVPAVYRIAEEALGVPAAMMGFVSSNGWDAAGAKAFGFRAFWVNRGGAPVERLGAPPDAILRSLDELPAAITSRDP
ncbi:MAG TPA: haloacid dehalogenase type II [Usitatibacter sp.]|jgi:2-haloacid dehalogenase|nr:haloacid dehalogenase type II [Usitatibacter sp.]